MLQTVNTKWLNHVLRFLLQRIPAHSGLHRPVALLLPWSNQFNGGFPPAATQMSSALGCIQEDVTMAYLCLFHRYDRYISDTVPSEIPGLPPVHFHDGMPGTHSLQPDFTMHTENIFLMICVCFLSGFFRMWGTFSVSPIPPEHYTFRKFLGFPLIYIIVLESIQLSGLVTMHQRLGQLAIHALVCHRHADGGLYGFMSCA